MRRAAGPLVLAPPLIVWLLSVFDAAPVLASMAAIFWIFVSIPVLIVVALDWFRHGTPSRPAHRALRHALRVPMLILGVAASVIGISVVVWVGYNLLWERQPQFRPGGSLGLMVVMVGFGWYLILLSLDRLPEPEWEPEDELTGDDALDELDEDDERDPRSGIRDAGCGIRDPGSKISDQ